MSVLGLFLIRIFPYSVRTEYGDLRWKFQVKCRKVQTRKPLNKDAFYPVISIVTALQTDMIIKQYNIGPLNKDRRN